MRCPPDVRQDDFKDMKSSLPKGAKFIKSKRDRWWWTFTFLLTKPIPGMKCGDHFTTSVVCKLK